ncbi:Atxe2 family lasso peptide isopeptidase [Novosphingobium sp.]|uniref:Atxe2 family lasso peptide isopeptidase n=1 Tax=Novosphingobium sp. TaxID=1874826 RepID=UPI0031CF2EFC
MRLAASVGLSIACLGAAPQAKASCDDLVSGSRDKPFASRLVTANDILRLRDIGVPDAAYWSYSMPLALSPDRRRLALVLNQADPESNGYCRALVVVNLDGPPAPHALDQGGDLLTGTGVVPGAPGGVIQHSGTPVAPPPVWSPDGQWVAYLRRDHGVTQLWRARADGKPGVGARGHPVTQSPVDVERFAWSPDSRFLIYRSTPALVEAEKAIDREGRSGWLNDARIMTTQSVRPLAPASLPQVVSTADLEGGTIAAATQAQRDLLLPPEDSLPSARSPSGLHAWTEHVSANPNSPLRLLVEGADGKRMACTGQDCTGSFHKLWWSGDGRSLIILRREGWNLSQMSLIRWVPGTSQFHRILLTDDVLRGCLSRGEALVCASENSVTPRHIVEIDLKSGKQRTVYDPNPEFKSLRLGTVTRLTWANDIGLPAWGDLVLPPDYKPGTKLPLVITQYHSLGFLRGGTGDEYPVYAFAARGFAVLSLDRPAPYGSDNPDLHDQTAIIAAGVKDWNERRSLLSSLVTGVKAVLARGVVDPARIGITGLSDGASGTRFALVNTRLFAAAAISTCCTDTNAMMNAGGIAFADAEHAVGYPRTIAHDEAFWAPWSMSLSATRMDRPMLMQLADRETQLALETFTALREAGQPVEMYIYPDEYHNKWQPVHRQAVYERNLDWFSFWLQGQVDPDPAKAAQFARWEAMKARRDQADSSGGS